MDLLSYPTSFITTQPHPVTDQIKFCVTLRDLIWTSLFCKSIPLYFGIKILIGLYYETLVRILSR